MEGILDLLFPKKCVNCGKLGSYVCEKCEVGLWEKEQVANSKLPIALDGLVSLWAYEGIAKKIIKQAKYKFYYDCLSELIVKSSWFIERPDYVSFDTMVVPVPLWPGRERERGFNQAKIISRSLGKILKLETKEVLIRVRDTGRQVGRSRVERLEAMKGAFEINPKFETLNPKQVLLVDDVWTTGATMGECAKVLKNSGVKKVWGLVLAR